MRSRLPSFTRCAAVALALAGACATSGADEPAAAPVAANAAAALRPDAFFAQLGVADEVVSATAGAIRDLRAARPASPWSAYVEASISRWESRSGYPSDHGVPAQLSAIPVLRCRYADGRSPWFVEGGIGATVTSSVYRNEGKHFSTAFNFGDHVGLGRAFGAARRDELALRFEHFSNAGIKHPNPGQNFVQLRYTHRIS